MSKSEVEFFPVPESCTVRRVVVAASAGRSSRRRRCNNTCCTSYRTSSSLIHLTSRTRTFSWIALIIIICCSCATRSVMSAPIHHSSGQDDSTEPEESSSTEKFREVRPKWVNPCGGVMDDAAADAAAGPPLPDAEVAANAILDVDIAIHHVQLFKDDFVRSTFRMSFNDMVRAYGHVRYDWLPGQDAVPKELGEKIPAAHLRSLNLGETLKKVYLAAQTLAVGLEQVVLDRAIYGGGFLEQFATTENKLSMVLCSLQMGMMEKHVEPDADAARQLMSNEYRDMRNASGRNLRDFIIMRDYINLLEYIQQIFHHFQETRSESS